jgi:purine-binding chemotaxis protein CheW
MTTEPPTDDNSLACKVLTFFLGNEEYGVDVLNVQEIISMVKITKVPKTPQFVKGVINLRGLVIPVVDLRLKFGMDSMGYDKKTCIMVVEVKRNEGDEEKLTSMGLVIDKISEVLSLESADIDPPPEFGTSIRTEFITGVAKRDDGIKILLDIHTVLSDEEMNHLQDVIPA